MRLFWILMAILGAGLILLIANNDAGSILGIENNVFAGALYLSLWGGVLLLGVFGGGIRLREAARSIAFWSFLLLALVAVYQYRYELQDVAHRVSAGLVPGSPISLGSENGSAHVLLERAPGGHFEVRAQIDGKPVRMLVDTGASGIVLTFSDTEAIGVKTDGLAFHIPVSTANGNALVARARIDTLEIGAIVRRDLTVYIAQPGQLGRSLLGMSFIDTLSGFDLRGDRLILRD
ncbi:retropepsin-like aspartic protease family protein [Nitratireductor indicus]|nr:TIGR02281 family clan AA aspartic protease [Nitratireductor indicus]SFQ15691.1 aspartyl protease family protein [Nitratireductor indicus]